MTNPSKSSLRAYGLWDSPLAADMLAAGNLRLGFPEIGMDGAVYFLESRPAEGGRNVLVRRTASGVLEDVTKAPFSARSRVHEYGGLSYAITPEQVFFVNAADQQMHRIRGGEAAEPLTRVPELRFAEPTVDLARRRLIAVAERHRLHPAQQGEPENCLVSIDFDTGNVSPLHSGRDFYAAPALSPDGKQLAFLVWDHPNMPWDGAEVWRADVAVDGTLLGSEHVAGSARGSAFQPTWSPDATLYFSLETGEFWNLSRYRNGKVSCVVELGAELAVPLWQLGTRVFAFSGPNTILGSCFRNGLSELVRIDVDAGSAEILTKDFPHIGHLTGSSDRVIFSVGFGTEIVSFDPSSKRSEILKSGHANLLDASDISTYEPVTFPTDDGHACHGFYYAPKNARFSAPVGSLPPLIVIAHGGPTGCTSPTFTPTIQFFTTRGFAVLDVNYRGSTGFGRTYREALRERWGVLDVDDCVAGARYLAAERRVDPTRLVIRGGSAGGYTVLQALANHDVFAAGSCHYGVSDIEALLTDTHKFESRYDRTLVGSYPEERQRFIDRSPIHYPERIQRPIVFFQGAEDRVVPPAQTRRMAEALKKRGIEAEYHEYAGEYHGFRGAETQRHVIETELAFLRRVLRLE